MPYLNVDDANKVQDAMQAAYQLMGGLSADTTAERLNLIAAIGILTSAKDAIASPGLREEANDQYGSDELEIDDQPATSPATDGTWVAAWVWIAQPDEDEEPDFNAGMHRDDTPSLDTSFHDHEMDV